MIARSRSARMLSDLGGHSRSRRALALLLFLLLGTALGFVARTRATAVAAQREPVAHTAALLEALVHLRVGRPGEATEVLRKRLTYVVRWLRWHPRARGRNFVLERAAPRLARTPKQNLDSARRETGPGAGR